MAIKRYELTRKLDDPRLNVGDMVEVREGQMGQIMAWYVPQDDAQSIRYVVEYETEKS